MMNEVTQQAHHYATILMKNMDSHNIQSPEEIADFALRLANSIERGLPQENNVQGETGYTPGTEHPEAHERPITGLHGPECTCTEEDEKAFIELLINQVVLPTIIKLGPRNK